MQNISPQRLRVGVRATRPWIVRDENQRLHILPAKVVWELLNFKVPEPQRWTTLGRLPDGTDAWLPIKGAHRFNVPKTCGARFEQFMSPTIAYEALYGRDSTLREGDDGRGVESRADAAPVRTAALRGTVADVVDLEQEIKIGLLSSGVALPMRMSYKMNWMHLEGYLARMKLQYPRGSEELVALSRLAALYIAASMVVAEGGLPKGCKMTADAQQVILRLAPARAEWRRFESDLRLISGRANCMRSARNLFTDTPCVIATLVLLCGYGSTRRVPSFVLHGDDRVQIAFLDVVKSVWRGSYLPRRRIQSRLMRAVTAAGLTYLSEIQRDRLRSIFFHWNGKERLLVAMQKSDPFPRPFGPQEMLVSSVHTLHGYALEIDGADHFVDGLSRVAIRNYIDCSPVS